MRMHFLGYIIYSNEVVDSVVGSMHNGYYFRNFEEKIMTSCEMRPTKRENVKRITAANDNEITFEFSSSMSLFILSKQGGRKY